MIQLKEFVENRDCDTIAVGATALSLNHLIYGECYYCINTTCKSMDCISLGNVVFEAYHFQDTHLCTKMSNGVYLPTAEKAILDTIVWLPENMNEGSLIEAIQTYQSRYGDKGKLELYKVADYYKVPHEFIDYWWKEAEEESDMSMG